MAVYSNFSQLSQRWGRWYAQENILNGWYYSPVIFPEANVEIVWLAEDGREVAGMFNYQDGWHTLDGKHLLHTPLRWRYADGLGPSLSVGDHSNIPNVSRGMNINKKPRNMKRNS